MLSQLLKAEMAEREVRSIAYHMKIARFPAYKDLSGFDFAASEVNEALIRQLYRCEFLDAAQNVVLIGGPGTGKSHLATALGIHSRVPCTGHDPLGGYLRFVARPYCAGCLSARWRDRFEHRGGSCRSAGGL